MIFQWGGVRNPCPPLDPSMEPDNVYTYWNILKIHFIVRIGFCTTLRTFYRMHNFLNWRNILSSIPFRSDVDPNRFFANLNRERERDWYMHILSGKSKCIDRLTRRERENVCSFWISSVFKLWELVYVFQSFVFIFAKKNLTDAMSLSDCITI